MLMHIKNVLRINYNIFKKFKQNYVRKPPRTDCLSDYLTDSMARRTTEGMANGSMAFITSLATRCVGHNQLIT